MSIPINPNWYLFWGFIVFFICAFTFSLYKLIQAYRESRTDEKTTNPKKW